MHIDLICQQRMRTSSEAAFALATDPDLFPGLFRGFGPIPGLREIRLHGPLAVGVTRDVEGSDGVSMRERVTALEHGQRHDYVLSGLRPPLAWLVREGQAQWTFAADGPDTWVTWQYRFVLTTPLAWPLAYPLLQVFMRGAMRRCLDAMALRLETPTAA